MLLIITLVNIYVTHGINRYMLSYNGNISYQSLYFIPNSSRIVIIINCYVKLITYDNIYIYYTIHYTCTVCNQSIHFLTTLFIQLYHIYIYNNLLTSISIYKLYYY